MSHLSARIVVALDAKQFAGRSNQRCIVTSVTALAGERIQIGGIVLATGNAAMNAITAPKPRSLNRLEGFALTAILQGFPTFAAAALLLKLARHEIAGGVVLFVVTASIFHGLFTPWLAPKFPKFFKHSYEPLFFNAGLCFAEKIEKWRAQPTTSLQLVTNVLMLSLLAVGVASMH